MREFSRRTTDALRATLPLRLALPHLEPLLALNVAKEARKDALVIRRAGDAVATGSPPGPEVAREILEATKAIDREFLGQVGRFPVRIRISYERIDPPRLRRIERGLDLSYRILDAWRRGEPLRTAFSKDEFGRRMLELLELYARETQTLSRSVRLPALLEPVRERLAQGLLRGMNDAATRLAGELARAVYRRDRPAD